MQLDRYYQIRDKIRTGDALFFSGKGRESSIIKRLTKSKFSHVGMALWLTPKVTDEPRLFIMESTTLNNIPDVTGEYRRGVQMVPLAQRLEGYDGEAWWLPLKDPITEDEKPILLDWCWKQETSKVPYDTAQLLAAAVDPEKWPFPFRWAKHFMPWANNRNNLKAVFCSEFYTATLQVMNRVDQSLIPAEQVPEDVYAFNCFMRPPTSLCREEQCEV